MREMFYTVVGALGSVLVYFLGGVDTVLVILFILMCVDFISGLIVAVVFKKSPKTETGKVNSLASFKGLCKKVFMCVLVGVANQLDVVLGTAFIRSGIVIAFITNETISIIENASLMGISIPKVMADAIDILHEKEETDHD